MLKYPCIGVLAAALVEPGRYELRDYPLPKPRSGCVLVKMNMSGIRGTDKHTYQGYTTQYFSAGKGEKIPFRSYENTGKVAGLGGDGQYNDFEGIPLRHFGLPTAQFAVRERACWRRGKIEVILDGDLIKNRVAQG